MISRRICWAEKKLVEVLHHSSDDRTFIIDHQTECDKKLAINYYPCWHYTLLETVQCTVFPVLFGAKKRLPHFSYTPDWRIPFVRLKTGITINYRGGLGRGCRGCTPPSPSPWDDLRLSNTVIQNLLFVWNVFWAVHIILLPSQKPSSSYPLLKFVYVTSH